jgi:hypothetical protein
MRSGAPATSPPGLTENDIAAEVFTGGERALLDALLPALRAGSTNDVKAADKLAPLAAGALDFAALATLESCLLSGEKTDPPFAAKRGKFPTKATRDVLGALADEALDDLMDRVAAARRARLSLEAARKTLALRRFAARFLPLYEARKRDRGWLSFDDLIRKARDLLRDRTVATGCSTGSTAGSTISSWTRRRTRAPGQWEVIEHLAEEFTAGEGARTNRERTLFVVGDKKQSIYSFQGADAEAFDRMRAHFEDRLRPISPLASANSSTPSAPRPPSSPRWTAPSPPSPRAGWRPTCATTPITATCRAGSTSGRFSKPPKGRTRRLGEAGRPRVARPSPLRARARPSRRRSRRCSPAARRSRTARTGLPAASRPATS